MRTPRFAVGAEARRLAVLQVDAVLLGLSAPRRRHRRCRCCSSGGSRRRRRRGAPPRARSTSGNVLAVGVHGARDEARLGADGAAERVERLDRSSLWGVEPDRWPRGLVGSTAPS